MGWLVLFTNAFHAPLAFWYAIISPLWSPLAYYYYLIHGVLILYCCFMVIETVIFRLLMIYAWKRIPPVQDDFFHLFLVLLSSMFSILIQLQRLVTKESFEVLFRTRWTPYKTMLPYEVLRMYLLEGVFILALTSVLCQGAVTLVSGIRKNQNNIVGPEQLPPDFPTNQNHAWVPMVDLAASSAKPKQKLEVPVIAINDEIQNVGDESWNNQVKNEEIFTGHSQVILVLICIGVTLPGTMAYLMWQANREMGRVQAALLDTSMYSVLAVIVPAIIYIRSLKLRNHVKDIINGWIYP